MENSLTVIQEVKHRPSNFTYMYIQKEWKHIYTQKLCANVHSCIIHNSKEVDRTQRSMMNIIYLYNGILSIHKKGWHTDKYYNIDEPWKFMLSERIQSQKITYYYMVTLIWMRRISKPLQTEIHWYLLITGEFGNKWGVTANEYELSFEKGG